MHVVSMGPIPRWARKRVARAGAARSADTGRDGRPQWVRDPVAIKVLARVFGQLMQKKSGLLAIELSEREARSFPSHRLLPGEDAPKGLRFVIVAAYGLDGCPAFSIAGAAPDATQEDVRAGDLIKAAQAMATARLQRSLKTQGLTRPAGNPPGGLFRG